MKPTPTTCMATSLGIPKRLQAIGIRRREPPATPEAPAALAAARMQRIRAVGKSTLIPSVCAAARAIMEMVIAAGFFMLCVAVCVSAFVMADHLSRVGQDVNHGVLAAESLVERVKVGNTGDFGTYEPDEVFGTVFENWKTKDPEAKAVYQYIKDGGEVRNYQILWDKEWNSYPDTKELEKNGKKLAYVGLITTGVKDQMKEIAVVIFGYGTYGDQGYKIYHLFAEQYVKP